MYILRKNDDKINAVAILIGVFLAGFIVRMIMAFFLDVFSKGMQSFEYEMIALNVVNGKGFFMNFCSTDYKAFVQPLYPVIIALVYTLIGKSHVVLMLFQCLVSSAIVFPMYSIARNFTGKKAALLAGFLCVFHPGLMIYSVVKLHTLLIDVFLFMVAIALLFKYLKDMNAKNSVLLGCLIGVACLSRFTILPFCLFSLLLSVIVLPFRGKLKVSRSFGLSVLTLVVAAIVYSPWVIRNYMVLDTFVLSQTSSGENLYVGNYPDIDGSSGLPTRSLIYSKLPQYVKDMNEVDQCQYFHDYFYNLVKTNPKIFIKKFSEKFYYFWWKTPATGSLYPGSWFFIYQIYYVVIFFAFLCGFYHCLKNKEYWFNLFLVFSYIMSISLLHAMVNVDTRHRWAIEPILLVFSSIAFMEMISHFSKESTKAIEV